MLEAEATGVRSVAEQAASPKSVPCVAVLKNLKNGKRYVFACPNGFDHGRSAMTDALNGGIAVSPHLVNSWRKYGTKSFSFEVHKTCELAELNDLVKSTVAQFMTSHPTYGYNNAKTYD